MLGLRALREYLHSALHLQLLPVQWSNQGEEVLIGGQAVIEGVMMRAPHSYCVVVQKPNGEFVTDRQAVSKPSERHRWLGWPLIRGPVVLGQAMYLGIKALKFSAEAVVEETSPPRERQAKGFDWALALNLAFSVGFFIFLYKFVPLWIATLIASHWTPLNEQLVFNLFAGVIRLLIFLGFLVAISQWAEIRRVFEYHGAEHMVVFNFESGEPLSVENARRYPTRHPRCGTSFLIVVMLVAILIYALVPAEDFASRFLARLGLLPLILSLSYEVIRAAARRQGLLLAFAQPGLWLQRITTRRPSDAQLRVAIHALEGALELERLQGGRPVIA